MQARLRAHNHWISLVALLVALLGGGYTIARSTAGSAPHSPPATAPSPLASNVPDVPPPATGCDPSFEKFTYHPARLVRIQDCIAVTGTVAVIRHEKDGDLHILFKLDPAFPGLTNSVNDAKQQGDLVVEPDCVGGPVTQADAIQPCTGVVPPPGLPLVRVGAHLKFTGPYVTDTQHGWDEVHPLEKVELVP